MDIKAIIFDFGGTLDTGGDHWSKVIQDGWKKAGVVADEALFHEAYVYAEQELQRTSKILPHHDFSNLLKIKIEIELGFLASHGHFPPAMIESKADEIASYCYGIAKEYTSQSGTVLEKLSQNYELALVSNFYGNLSTVLKELNLIGYFKLIEESSGEESRKPSTILLEKAIKALGYSPEQILVVGDSEKNDISPAKQLGCHTVLLNGRSWDDKIIDSLPEKTIDSLDEILGYLESI
ncbi:MAG: HAD family hydrolase [Muribaculaceae bacterium]|nr:HAD family hydrolase [Muribaculaceae bacterium]